MKDAIYTTFELMESLVEIFIAAALSSVLTASLLGVLLFLFREWIARRIQYSIKHEYDRKLADLEHERSLRLKAELVADLLSEWIRPDCDFKKLNDLSFKAFLWLPTDIASELSAALSHQPGAPDIRKLLIRIRWHLLGEKDYFESHKVIVFEEPRKNEAQLNTEPEA